MPKVQDQFDEDGTPRDAIHERRAGRFLDEFEWYSVALKEARARGVTNASIDAVRMFRPFLSAAAMPEMGR